MDSEPFDERIVVRVPSDLKAQIQKVAEEEETTLTGAARILIREGIDSGWRIEEKIKQIKSLQEQNDSILGTYASLLNQTEIAQSNFNICVITLMKVLEGNVSDNEKRQLVAQFAPYAELARRQQEEAKRQYEERQKMVAEAKAAARKKKSVDE